MTVYIESNFVLEHALQLEECESCRAIIELASSGQISLAVPAFSLAEPHVALSGKERARSRLGNDLRAHLSELGRSRPHQEVRASFEPLAALLIASVQGEREGLRDTISKLLSSADLIALDTAILRSAGEVQTQYGMSGQDAIVLASVISHLELHRPSESCFLNRNSKDFDDPNVRERLEALGCRFFAKFEDGLRYIVSRTGTAGPFSG
jgi:hypothetical protein